MNEIRDDKFLIYTIAKGYTKRENAYNHPQNFICFSSGNENGSKTNLEYDNICYQLRNPTVTRVMRVPTGKPCNIQYQSVWSH